MINTEDMIMRTGRIILITGLTMIVCLFCIYCLSMEGTGAEIIVDAGGGGDHTTIQQAVDNSTDGDTIIVKDGTYTENVVVNKEVTIRSEHGAVSTSVHAKSESYAVFRVDADNVTISGFKITGAKTTTTGVELVGHSGCTISHNEITDNEAAIMMWGSSNNNLMSNNIHNNSGWAAINMQMGCNDNVIWDNILTRNGGFMGGDGIYLGISCFRNTIDANTVTNHNGWGENIGIFIDHYCELNIVSGNTVSDNNQGIVLNDQSHKNEIFNNTIKMNIYIGLALINMYPDYGELGCSNNSIHNNTITGNGNGTNVSGGSKDNTFRDNHISGNEYSGMDAQHNLDEEVDAKKNWWGDDSGPLHTETNPDGKGDMVFGTIDFEDWKKGLINLKQPVVFIDSPANHTEVNGTVTIKGHSTDPQGEETLDHVEFRFDPSGDSRTGTRTDEGVWTNVLGAFFWTHEWDTYMLDNKEYIISVRAFDGDMYSEIKQLHLMVNNSIMVDEQPPEIFIISPANNSKVNGTIEVSGTVTDPNGDDTITGVKYAVDAGEWIDATGKTAWLFTVDTKMLLNEQHQIAIKAHDSNGNNSDEVLIVVLVDNPDEGDGDDTEEDDDDGFIPAFGLPMMVMCVSISLLLKRRKS